jgi:hypothetical protein
LHGVAWHCMVVHGGAGTSSLAGRERGGGGGRREVMRRNPQADAGGGGSPHTTFPLRVGAVASTSCCIHLLHPPVACTQWAECIVRDLCVGRRGDALSQAGSLRPVISRAAPRRTRTTRASSGRASSLPRSSRCRWRFWRQTSERALSRVRVPAVGRQRKGSLRPASGQPPREHSAAATASLAASRPHGAHHASSSAARRAATHSCCRWRCRRQASD